VNVMAFKCSVSRGISSNKYAPKTILLLYLKTLALMFITANQIALTVFQQRLKLLQLSRPIVFKSVLIGRPFVKRFALCYQTVVCLFVSLSCPSVMFVHCGQTVGQIKINLASR